MVNWLSPNPFRSELTEQSRADYEQQVKGPGKFGGEQPYVPYFHDVSLHGFVEEEASYPEGGGWVGIFTVDEDDRKLFPELDPVGAEELMEEMRESYGEEYD